MSDDNTIRGAGDVGEEPIVEQKPAEMEAPRPPAQTQPDIESRAPVARSAAGRRGSQRASSDVGALPLFGLAIPFYGLAVLGARLAPAGARELLLERGWPPHATMIITALALAILITKTVMLRRQRRAFSIDLLPAGEGRIGPEDASRLVAQIEPARTRLGARSFLIERVSRVLAQYAARGEVGDAASANEAESEADAASVAASFSTVKVLVWAMPILGLIGTVIGLSGAVGAFSHAMSGAEQLDTIKDSLREVTTGLAVAFDATFVALVASILVMLPMTWLQKSEDRLINDVDDHAISHLLSRLGAASEKAPEPSAGEVKQMALDALAQPLAEMLAANARVMDRLAEDRAALTGAGEALIAQLTGFAAALHKAAPVMERAAAQLEKTTSEIEPRLERVLAALDGSVAATAKATQGTERAASQIERAASEMESRVGPSVERAAAQIDRAAAELGAGVGRAVSQLEMATTVAEQSASAAERAQDQLSRELGASRQLLSLLAAGLGAGDQVKPRHVNTVNGEAKLAHGSNGSNGSHPVIAARGA